MSNLFIEIVSYNASNGYPVNFPNFEETKYSNKTELYRAFVKEYGKCTGKQYIDSPKGKRVQIGWIFEKRELYSDVRLGKSIRSLDKEAKEKYTFILETWVSVHTAKPETKTINHFAKF